MLYIVWHKIFNIFSVMGDVSYVSSSAPSTRLKRAQNPIIVVVGSKTAQAQVVSSIV